MVVRGGGQVLLGETHWTAAVADVVEAAVQRVVHLVADYWPHVVLRGRKNSRLLVCEWMRGVGQGVGLGPQQGRGGDRGRRLLQLLLDA